LAARYVEGIVAGGEDLSKWGAVGVGSSRARLSHRLSCRRRARVSWHTANSAILAEGKRRLIDDPHRFDGVSTIGVDEHVWRHTRFGDKYVTVIIDLTPAREKAGPARLLRPGSDAGFVVCHRARVSSAG